MGELKMEYTLEEIMTKGYACLEKELGYIGMERFIAEVNSQRFDYVQWRREFFDKMSDDEFFRDLTEFADTHHYTGKAVVVKSGMLDQ